MAQHLRIKICGVTQVTEAVECTRLGADALGLNFYPPSPRCLDISTAAAILNAIHNAVGVRIHSLPATAEKVYAAIKAKREKNAGLLTGGTAQLPEAGSAGPLGHHGADAGAP